MRKRPKKLARMMFGTLACTLAANGTLAQTAPKTRMSTEIPPGIAIPGEVETRLGTLKFFDGFPDE